MASESTQPRYLARFRCIAERCEDTCCSGLKVPVSESQWRRMRDTVAGDPEASQRLHACVSLHPGGDASQHAFLRAHADGSCRLLDSERLCSLQRRYGEAMLPDICATFPRALSVRGERAELTGTLACPEIARQCLLAEDGVEAVPVSPEELARVSRPSLARPPPDDRTDAARPALLRLLLRREYPLRSRLALLGRLAAALDEAPGPGAAWDAVLQRFEDPALLDALHQEFSALAFPGGALVGLFHAALQTGLVMGRGGRFEALLRGVQTSLPLTSGSPEALEAAWHTYGERWRHLEASQGERLHQYFHHYAHHLLWRLPLIQAPTLLTHVFRLALRLGLLRLTLMGHADVAALCAEPTLPPDTRERLDRAAVETFQLVARNVESASDFTALVAGLAGSGRGEDTLGKVLVFAAF